VDCVLVPEIDFQLGGPGGLLEYLEQRLLEKGHVNVVKRRLPRSPWCAWKKMKDKKNVNIQKPHPALPQYVYS
jgi:hypothetical protein